MFIRINFKEITKLKDFIFKKIPNVILRKLGI